MDFIQYKISHCRQQVLYSMAHSNCDMKCIRSSFFRKNSAIHDFFSNFRNQLIKWQKGNIFEQSQALGCELCVPR